MESNINCIIFFIAIVIIAFVIRKSFKKKESKDIELRINVIEGDMKKTMEIMIAAFDPWKMEGLPSKTSQASFPCPFILDDVIYKNKEIYSVEMVERTKEDSPFKFIIRFKQNIFFAYQKKHRSDNPKKHKKKRDYRAPTPSPRKNNMNLMP